MVAARPGGDAPRSYAALGSQCCGPRHGGLNAGAVAERDADLLREMIKTFAEVLLVAAEVEACAMPTVGAHTSERTNSRNGHRRRDWDTRAGTTELAVPSCGRTHTSRTCCSSAGAMLHARAGPSPRTPLERTIRPAVAPERPGTLGLPQ